MQNVKSNQRKTAEMGMISPSNASDVRGISSAATWMLKFPPSAELSTWKNVAIGHRPFGSWVQPAAVLWLKCQQIHQKRNGLLSFFLDSHDPPTMQSTTPRINRCFWHSKGDPEATQSQPPSIVLFGSSPNLTLEFQRLWRGCSIFVGRDWNMLPLKSWSIGHG